MDAMDRLRVRVYYDFASSPCYVAHRMMERVARELDVSLRMPALWMDSRNANAAALGLAALAGEGPA
jgi:predicted DsbA family dithiol-disulfide isomerase